MALDPAINFGLAEVSGLYNDSVQVVTLNAGEISNLPPIAEGAYNITWWDSTVYTSPISDPNVEIIRVTGVAATNDLLVTRGQEGTSASTKNTTDSTYKVFNGVTKKTIDDLDNRVFGTEEILFSVQGAKLPAANPAAIDGSNVTYKLIFDDTTSESAHWETTLKNNYGTGINPSFEIPFTLAANQTGAEQRVISFSISVDSRSTGAAENIDVTSYDTANSGDYTLIPHVTGGFLYSLNIPLTNTDSAQSGDYVRFKIARNVGVANNATGDVNVVSNPRLKYTIA